MKLFDIWIRYDSVDWKLDNGIESGMTPNQVSKILKMKLKKDFNITMWETDSVIVELDFHEFVDTNNTKLETKLVGIYVMIK